MQTIGHIPDSNAIADYFHTSIDMELISISLDKVIKVAITSYLIKVTYSIVRAGPANLLVNYIKKLTGIDVYDFPKELTPFHYKESAENYD